MDFMQVVRRRRSIRKYKPDHVPEEVLKEILEAGRLAPSAANRQPWHFIVVSDRDRKEQMQIPGWVAQAPLILVVCGDPEISETWAVVDPTIAMQNMVLAATDHGLGTCWIGRLGRDEKMKSALGIPERMKVVALTPLGYPDESPPSKERKPLREIVHYESF